MKKPRDLFKDYKKTDVFKDLSKDYENLFILGAQAIMFRGTELLNSFFNSKSDVNKYLTAEQQEELEKQFGEWCIDNLL